MEWKLHYITQTQPRQSQTIKPSTRAGSTHTLQSSVTENEVKVNQAENG